MKPTEDAERILALAWNDAQLYGITNFEQVGRALGNLALGLIQTNVGLRATYIKLEQVEALIKRQGRAPGQK